MKNILKNNGEITPWWQVSTTQAERKTRDTALDHLLHQKSEIYMTSKEKNTENTENTEIRTGKASKFGFLHVVFPRGRSR